VIRLVVNADDLGLHPAIDEGILRAHRDGIVTSATLLATGCHAAEAVALARAQGLALGVHLCLSTRLACAAPASAVPTVAPDGRFRASWASFIRDLALRRVRLDEVARELKAQVARARELGAEVDHLDGHQHLHVLPGIAGVVQDLAREERLPLRWPVSRPEGAWLRRPPAALKALAVAALGLAAWPRGANVVRGVGVFEAGVLDEARLLRMVDALGPGDHEMGAHPGLAPPDVPEDPGWRYGWEQELEALCSARVWARVRERGIQLVTYRQMSQPRTG
jgi:predicted glycoside hydrolase/deacetylase ChbG (UPF0249 family)